MATLFEESKESILAGTDVPTGTELHSSGAVCIVFSTMTMNTNGFTSGYTFLSLTTTISAT